MPPSRSAPHSAPATTPRPPLDTIRGHHPPHPDPPGPDALAGAIGAWLADREGPDRRRRAVAVDATTLRGARRDGRQVHLLAAMEHATRAVLAHHQVNGAPGEVPGLRPLLADLDLTGAGGHRRRAPDPRWGGTVPGRWQARALAVHHHGQPAHTPWVAASGWPGMRFRSWTAPVTAPTAA
jgi:hypothetical protein